MTEAHTGAAVQSADLSGAPVRLGMLVGGGSVPGEVAAAAVARGWPVHVVAIDGEADGSFPGISVTNVDWGQIGRMLRAFKENGVTHLVIVGRVRRPDMTRLKPDFGLVRAIPAILRIMASGGDDGVLRGVIRFFEGHGLTVIGPGDVAPGLAAGNGPLGAVAPAPSATQDIAKGLQIVRLLGAFDVGQSVVVRDGSVIAIEGAEGTDGMLSRVTPARSAGQTSPPAASGVLVKRPKPHQDMRVDMPAIGPDTVTNAARAGLAGIAVHAGKVLVTQRAAVEEAAAAHGLFVVGVADTAVVAPGKRAGRHTNDAEDVARGTAILAALRPHVGSRSVVVTRKYVLAIETGEGTEQVLQRVKGLRQWGSERMKRRAGILVLADAEPVTEQTLVLADAAGLRGIAFAGPPASLGETLRTRASALGLTLHEQPRAGVSLP